MIGRDRVLLVVLGGLLIALGIVLCVIPILVLSPLLGLSRIYLGIVIGLVGVGAFFYGLFNKKSIKKAVVAILDVVTSLF